MQSVIFAYMELTHQHQLHHPVLILAHKVTIVLQAQPILSVVLSALSPSSPVLFLKINARLASQATIVPSDRFSQSLVLRELTVLLALKSPQIVPLQNTTPTPQLLTSLIVRLVVQAIGAMRQD